MPSSACRQTAVVFDPLYRWCLHWAVQRSFQGDSVQPVLLSFSLCAWKECAGEHLARVWGIWRILEQRRHSMGCSLPLVNVSPCKVLLMSVWGEPPACELVSQRWSTRASACPALAVMWLCALGESDASGHTPGGWSCPWGHFRSYTCCWAGGGGVPSREPCMCPGNSLAFLTDWQSF